MRRKSKRKTSSGRKKPKATTTKFEELDNGMTIKFSMPRRPLYQRRLSRPGRKSLLDRTKNKLKAFLKNF